jgi:hypothetical protein
MPTSGRCKSHMAAGVRVYDGLCVIPGSSLTQTSISLTANTQISGTWSILSGQTVNLAPGTYWVTGDLNLESNGVLKCSACNNAGGIGVTIILTTTGNKIGALSMAASASFNLNAPRSGRLAGVVIAQDSNGLPPGTSYTSSHSTIGGAATATLNGLVYFPNSSLRFHGAPSAADPKCLVLVVGAVSIDAASNLESGGCPTAGITNFPTISTVALAE